jgi:intracellular sulfur oxidation DsrE/DsrF family protein
MTDEERAVLDAKMAEMERVLADELAALQEQEVDIYVCCSSLLAMSSSYVSSHHQCYAC